jgi:hypothetical protein
MDVVDDALVSRREQTAHHARAHASETDHSELHVQHLLSIATPPDDGTVQMSPPDTNAIVDPSGEIAGSAYAGRGVMALSAGAALEATAAPTSRRTAASRCMRGSIVGAAADCCGPNAGYRRLNVTSFSSVISSIA